MSISDSTLQNVAPRLARFWLERSSWQRRWLLVAIGLLAMLLAWCLIPKPTQYTVLFGGQAFDRSQQVRFETALARARLSDFEIQDGTLRVPKDQRAAYLAALEDHGALPEALGERTRQAVNRMNPFQTADERNRRIEEANRRDIAEVVRSLQGVEEAFLQLNEVAAQPFSRDKHRTAMLAIRLASDSQVTPQLIHTARSIVVSSQAGLKPQDVTIVDLRSGRTFAESAGALQVTDEYLAVKESYERMYRTKMERHLAHIRGLRVTANVELQRTSAPASAEQWTPQSVNASLAVPERYLAMRAEVVEGKEQAIEELRRAAISVLPSPGPGCPPPTVSVAAFDSGQPTTRSAEVASPLTSPLAIGMMICFGLLGLVFAHAVLNDLRRWRRQPDTAQVEPPDLPMQPRTEVTLEQPVRIHERLTELVRENPKVAADTITEWVRKAG